MTGHGLTDDEIETLKQIKAENKKQGNSRATEQDRYADGRFRGGDDE